MKNNWLKEEYIRPDFKKVWSGNLFEHAETQQGQLYRNKEGRRTLSFEVNQHSFFLKFHQGIGWKEIIKNLVQGRLPVLGAKNEWQAIQLLKANQIDTMSIAAYGKMGWNPARQCSFIVTDALTDTMSLEHLAEQWAARPPSYKSKRTLIKKLALITKKMHDLGMNHRDYYLCHFLLDKSFAIHNEITDDTSLFLIDLHRAQLRKTVPTRWKIKDLAGLYFSAMDVPLSERDLYLFIFYYSGGKLKSSLSLNKSFWHQVSIRANKLAQKHHA
jgi:heptose I phosphotransferase